MADGRFALVTGAAQGIGFATAKRFLELGFGGVLLLDRNGPKLREAAARLQRVEILEGDVLDLTLPKRAVQRAVEAFGGIDVLVNAAGSTERCGIDDTSPEAFERVFGINVRAPMFMMQEALAPMRKRGAGVIINVSSMLSHGGPPNLATYCASKSALNTLTKSAANTVKRQGIRVFAINLGWVLTEGEHATQTGIHGLPQNWAEDIGRRMPSGRLITADDVAGLMAFLVSPPAQMMTGAIIDYEQMPVGVFDAHPALGPE